MSVCLPKGILTLSVDLEVDAARPELIDRRRLEDVTAWLVSLAARYRMPITWGVADPAVSAATEQILASRAGHEIALCGDSSWVGREAGRSRFARELTRRTRGGRGAGLPLSTLILKAAQLDGHCDLAIKHGITAVRHSLLAGGKPDVAMQPHTLRFGLWSFPLAYTLPGDSRWLPGGGGASAARLLIDQAATSRGLVQLSVEADILALRGRSAERVVERVVAHAERRRQQGLLDVATIGATAEKLASHYRGQPSRSILLPAA